MKKVLLGLLAACMMLLPVFAKNVKFDTYDIPWKGDLENDLAAIINSNKGQIESALKSNKVTKEQVDDYMNAIIAAYNELGVKDPYTNATNGLDGFSDAIKDSLPNTQIQQNVWANSWIGYLVQVGNGLFCPRFGLGANVGLATMDVSALKNTGEAFKMDLGGMPDMLALPTVTFDARVGGVKVGDFALPFDFGFSICTLDSSQFGLDSVMDKVNFDFLSLGFDIRYCLWEPHVLDTKLSVGAGYYYTKGSVGVDSDNADASLDFKSSNFTLNGQISTKLLFFRPFVGARLMFTNSEVNWGVKNLNWSNILDSSDSDGMISKAIVDGLLPSSISGGADGFKFRPVIQGGFAFDFAVIDLTFSASYDFSSSIAGGAFSLRFSL